MFALFIEHVVEEATVALLNANLSVRGFPVVVVVLSMLCCCGTD